jgi:hypothetical protein
MGWRGPAAHHDRIAAMFEEGAKDADSGAGGMTMNRRAEGPVDSQQGIGFPSKVVVLAADRAAESRRLVPEAQQGLETVAYLGTSVR